MLKNNLLKERIRFVSVETTRIKGLSLETDSLLYSVVSTATNQAYKTKLFEVLNMLYLTVFMNWTNLFYFIFL